VSHLHARSLSYGALYFADSVPAFTHSLTDERAQFFLEAVEHGVSGVDALNLFDAALEVGGVVLLGEEAATQDVDIGVIRGELRGAVKAIASFAERA
jgi:hypothetical protein